MNPFAPFGIRIPPRIAPLGLFPEPEKNSAAHNLIHSIPKTMRSQVFRIIFTIIIGIAAVHGGETLSNEVPDEPTGYYDTDIQILESLNHSDFLMISRYLNPNALEDKEVSERLVQLQVELQRQNQKRQKEKMPTKSLQPLLKLQRKISKLLD
ncbi:hypothetical protein BCR33DRAFT_768978 [Rhizoclosmatium globosum]|uniref:Uncharacterized protein n=1 Tax=Rhizoclosmatium globosum TaxID=329046 RepID=A0A1Y2BVY6_9FUNG|nr:hypothetical protein BCR33DRAFT_768978 [Rhizoclosmatium globosum]|eukprot:ORY38834.1 hypothetical protein BCR33DRAFT_768978 [Rhizoclosmatium globosum]